MWYIQSIFIAHNIIHLGLYIEWRHFLDIPPVVVVIPQIVLYVAPWAPRAVADVREKKILHVFFNYELLIQLLNSTTSYFFSLNFNSSLP